MTSRFERRAARGTLLAAVSLCAFGAHAGAAPARAPAGPVSLGELAGRWIGGYELGGERTSGSLTFRVGRDGLVGTFAPSVPAGDSAVVRVAGARAGAVRLTIAGARGEFVLAGTRAGGRLAGTARGPRGNGRFEFARTIAMPSERFARFVGDYALPTGDTLVIGRSLSQLFVLASDTGRQSALWATDDSSFVGGPSVGTTFPLERSVAFSGRTRSALNWRTRGEPERQAPRVIPYDEEDVTFSNGAFRLAGTVLMPRSRGPHPGVVLVHGSNAQSRNGQRSIYRFHADHLARRGIAVLIYDKRGIGGSGGHWDDTGLAGDALAAARVLRQRAGVDPARVGLWGISQGAWLVGQAAAAAPSEIAFLALVGGGALQPHVQEIERTAMQMRADGFREDDIRRAVELQRLKFRYARRREGWSEYLAAVDSARGRPWLDDPYIGPPTSADSPAWEFWRSGAGSDAIDPASYLPRVRCPVLALAGALDSYSAPNETLTLLDTYLQRGGNSNVRTWLVPNASHALFEARTGGPKEEPFLARFAPGYLDTLAAWIGRVPGRR